MRFANRKVLVLILFLAITAAGVVWLGQRGRQQQVPAAAVLHHAADPAVSLSHIDILAFYFMPSDAAAMQSKTWQQDLPAALSATAQFYRFQLHNAGSVDFRVFPQRVTGRQASAFYDGNDTGHGNPHALLAVREELIRRALTEGGDLYDKSFAQQPPGEFQAIAILYEGVGASATQWVKSPAVVGSDLAPLPDNGRPAFLISRAFLSDQQYQDFGTTIFAHEFGHTLGLSDSYNQASGDPTGDDIMGTGRFRPLNATYISTDSKRQLGLMY